MNEILKRLEIIKSSIAIDDEEIIELQIMKLNKLSPNIEIKNIISKLENQEYSSALIDIENYLKRYNSVVEYIDTEVQSLKLELKSLENKLQTLIEQKTECLNDIDEFNTLYNLYLGELLKDILNLKKEILYKQTIKQQKEKARYEDAELEIADLKFEISYIESQMEELLEKWQNIQPDDKNYNEIFTTYKELQKELEKLENELKDQEENLSKIKEEIDNNEVFEEYEESKKQYEQFHQNYEDTLWQQADVFDITNEQKIELKKLWKKACKLCHPDIVIDKFKEKAHEIMQALNDAYSKKDIVKLKEILSNLENGLTFEIESDNINDKEILKSKINQYKKNILELENEIKNLQHDETYKTIQEIDDIDEYFEELKSELQNEKDRLENETREIFENIEENNVDKNVETIQKCPAFELENYDELSLFIENWITQELFKQDINVNKNVMIQIKVKESSKQVANELIRNKISNISLPFLITNSGKIENFFIDNVTYKTFHEIDDTDEYFEELKSELQNEKDRLEEVKGILKNDKDWIDELTKKATVFSDSYYTIVSDSTFEFVENDEINKRQKDLNNQVNEKSKEKDIIKYNLYVPWLESTLIDINNFPKFINDGDGMIILLTKYSEPLNVASYDSEEELYHDLDIYKNTLLDPNCSLIRVKDNGSVLFYDKTSSLYSELMSGLTVVRDTDFCEEDGYDNYHLSNIDEQIENISIEKSDYSIYIQSIENINFEKIRRYCNNLLDDNQADEMQKYLAEQGKMYKAIIYDALEQFIEKLDDETITLVDWGCEQGIGSMLVLDYIKEKQLDIIVNQIILLDDNTTAINRAMSQIKALKQNDIELLVIQNDTQLEVLKNIKNNITLNIFVDDKFPVDYLAIDYELFENAYFICVSNSNKNFVDKTYENISDFNNIEDISIRDNKIGRFDRYEKIFKINNYEQNILEIDIDEDEIPF